MGENPNTTGEASSPCFWWAISGQASKLLWVLSLCALASACGIDRGSGLVRLKLRVTATDADATPAPGVEIILTDRRVPEEFWRPRKRVAACVTQEDGTCQAEVRYGFSSTSWPWQRPLDTNAFLRDRFEVEGIIGGRMVIRQVISQVTALQLQGVEELRCDLQLPAATHEVD